MAEDETYRLAAGIEAEAKALVRHDRAVLVEDTLVNHADEVEDAGRSTRRGVTTLINTGRGVHVPRIAERLYVLVEFRVRSNRCGACRESLDRRTCLGGVSRVGEGVIVGDQEAVAIGSETEDKLVRGEAGGSPSHDRRYSGALLIGRGSAGVVQGRVGTDGVGPKAPDVVVHDSHVVENLGKFGDIVRRSGIRTVEGNNGGSSGEGDVRSLATELLQERQEVGGVSRVDDIAPSALLVGVLPATKVVSERRIRNRKCNVLEVEAIQVVLLYEVHHRVHERSAVVCSCNSGGKVLRTSPATDGEHGLRVL